MTTRPAALFLIGVSIAVAADCGRKGPLELTPGRAPMAVERLTAVLEDGGVRLTWTNPVKTVAGRPLGPVGAAEIWVFEKDLPAAGASLTAEAVEKSARLAGRLDAAAAPAASFTFAPAPAGAKDLAFTVRVRDRKGRESAFSPVAVLTEREGP
jgi:predicted small lipoprotein YifL